MSPYSSPAPVLTVTVSSDGEVAVYPGEDFGPEHLQLLAETARATQEAVAEALPMAS